MKTFVGTALTLAMLATAPAWAGDAKLGALEIKSAWARATPPKAAAGGAFLSVTNTGAAADTLLRASSDVAKTVELHTHLQQGEVMRMMAVDKIEVPPGQTVALAPGGLHIMLIGLKQPLAEGTSFPLELTFANAGKVTVTVDVKAIGAMNSGAAMMHDPARHQQNMADPAYKAMHEQHMADPAHKAMHDQMMKGR
ncbi:MAG: copper chaperone PCu(A)C [Rhodospirillaceae bacterium]|nr:copper chaperone PCu(A)C [Rhodospirillales bacterium]